MDCNNSTFAMKLLFVFLNTKNKTGLNVFLKKYTTWIVFLSSFLTTLTFMHTYLGKG